MSRGLLYTKVAVYLCTLACSALLGAAAVLLPWSQTTVVLSVAVVGCAALCVTGVLCLLVEARRGW